MISGSVGRGVFGYSQPYPEKDGTWPGKQDGRGLGVGFGVGCGGNIQLPDDDSTCPYPQVNGFGVDGEG